MPLVCGKLSHMAKRMSYILDLLGCFLMVLINLFPFASIFYKLVVRSKWLITFRLNFFEGNYCTGGTIAQVVLLHCLTLGGT